MKKGGAGAATAADGDDDDDDGPVVRQGTESEAARANREAIKEREADKEEKRRAREVCHHHATCVADTAGLMTPRHHTRAHNCAVESSHASGRFV